MNYFDIEGSHFIFPVESKGAVILNCFFYHSKAIYVLVRLLLVKNIDLWIKSKIIYLLFEMFFLFFFGIILDKKSGYVSDRIYLVLFYVLLFVSPVTKNHESDITTIDYQKIYCDVKVLYFQKVFSLNIVGYSQHSY